MVKEEITRGMGTFIKINDTEHPPYKNLWIQLKQYLKGSL